MSDKDTVSSYENIRRQREAELQKEINRMLAVFQKNTGLVVWEIDLAHIHDDYEVVGTVVNVLVGSGQGR